MDCMASNAATKNGLVLSSLPAASGILVQSPGATTECEFDLARKPRLPNRLEPWIAHERNNPAHFRPDHKSLMACSIKSRPSRFAATLRADLDLICARHLHSSTVGTKSWPAIEQRADQPP
jgi:hypothetical protein